MRWMFQVGILVLVLLFGVFLGIDRAERHMQAIQGTEGAPRVFEVTTPQEGKMEIAVLGETYETGYPAGEERLEHGKNALSRLGNKAGEAFEWAARRTLERLFELIEKLFP